MTDYRDIGEFFGYQVGRDGTFRCNLGRGGHRGKPVPWRPLSPIRIVSGYMHVALRRDGKYHHKLCHRLVLEAFVGPCPDGMECRHLNGVKADNRLENLAWGTKAQNVRDQKDHGTFAEGSKKPQAKFKEADIPVVRARLAAGESQQAVADDYGVCQTTVSKVFLRLSWNHVT